uniref:Fumarylacetoacetate hydrolase domain-containing protein 2 n=1 Tax=Cacopsylla melanoneura TaxID=428564 RepID=A0A8D8U0Q0_9HEMI
MSSSMSINKLLLPLIFSSRLTLTVSSRPFSKSLPSTMRFVQFKPLNGNGSNPQRLGVQLERNGDIINLSTVDPSMPNNLVQFLEGGTELIEKAKRMVSQCKSMIRLSEVELLPPITRPDKILCIALNYKDHCDEQNKTYPETPFFFNKFPSTIVGPFSEVICPANVTRYMDWEVELAVIIGKRTKNVKPHEAMDAVFGYTIAQDISARDWQKPTRNGGQWLFAKSLDTFCPLGPSVVMKEYLNDPHDVTLTCRVNGQIKQNASSSNMLHKIPNIVSYLSEMITLLPGDVILTGTPAGVGVFRKPIESLKAGDIVESEISGIGKIQNKIV